LREGKGSSPRGPRFFVRILFLQTGPNDQDDTADQTNESYDFTFTERSCQKCNKDKKESQEIKTGLKKPDGVQGIGSVYFDVYNACYCQCLPYTCDIFKFCSWNPTTRQFDGDIVLVPEKEYESSERFVFCFCYKSDFLTVSQELVSRYQAHCCPLSNIIVQ